MKKFTNLNGWQRIYVVFLAVIYLPISFMIFSDTSPNSMTHRELLSVMSNETLKAMYSDDVIVEEITFRQGTFSPGKYLAGNTKKYDPLEVNLAFGWNFEVSINSDLKDDTAKNHFESINSALKKEYQKRKWTKIAESSFFVIIGALLIYLLGWSVGWIRAGFKK